MFPPPQIAPPGPAPGGAPPIPGAPPTPAFPSTDPTQLLQGGIFGNLQQIQGADQQALAQQQAQAAMLALVEAMKNQPNPEAAAAASAPGYAEPPPAQNTGGMV
jgi:hypothetical protein